MMENLLKELSRLGEVSRAPFVLGEKWKLRLDRGPFYSLTLSLVLLGCFCRIDFVSTIGFAESEPHKWISQANQFLVTDCLAVFTAVEQIYEHFRDLIDTYLKLIEGLSGELSRLGEVFNRQPFRGGEVWDFHLDRGGLYLTLTLDLHPGRTHVHFRSSSGDSPLNNAEEWIDEARELLDADSTAVFSALEQVYDHMKNRVDNHLKMVEGFSAEFSVSGDAVHRMPYMGADQSVCTVMTTTLMERADGMSTNDSGSVSSENTKVIEEFERLCAIISEQQQVLSNTTVTESLVTHDIPAISALLQHLLGLLAQIEFPHVQKVKLSNGECNRNTMITMACALVDAALVAKFRAPESTKELEALEVLMKTLGQTVYNMHREVERVPTSELYSMKGTLDTRCQKNYKPEKKDTDISTEIYIPLPKNKNAEAVKGQFNRKDNQKKSHEHKNKTPNFKHKNQGKKPWQPKHGKGGSKEVQKRFGPRDGQKKWWQKKGKKGPSDANPEAKAEAQSKTQAKPQAPAKATGPKKKASPQKTNNKSR